MVMNVSPGQAAYRIRRFYSKDDKPKKYKCSYEVIDERSQQVMACCDLIGKAMFSTLTILDHNHKSWQMKPNRKIMPSRWTVTAPSQRVVLQFDQKILGKFVNPIYKVVLVLLDAHENEIYRLVDSRTSIPDRVFSSNPGKWTILSNDKPVAKLGRLPREKEQATGILGKFKKLLKTSDPAVISATSEHVLSAPVVVGMYMLFWELEDSSV